MHLSAMLKAHGYEVYVLVEPFERADLTDLALQRCPDVVTFSCLTWDFRWALEHARRLKGADTRPLVILGGTHVTLNPEDAATTLGESPHAGSYSARSPLDQPDIRKTENLHKVFALVAEHPVLQPAARALVRFEALAPLFSFLYRLHQRRVVARRRRRDGF